MTIAMLSMPSKAAISIGQRLPSRATGARRTFIVKASTEEKPSEVSVPDVPATETTPAPPTPAPAAAPAAAPSSLSFGDAMAFAGPAPELVNGRLAQLGFVAALFAELASGETVLQQFADAPVPIILTFVTFAAASLIPILKGTKREAFGPLTPAAEMANGRAAMIGLAALLVIEGVKGSALF